MTDQRSVTEIPLSMTSKRVEMRRRLVASRVKVALRQAGYTQNGAADELGIARQTLSSVVLGRTRTWKIRSQIAHLARRPISDLWPVFLPLEGPQALEGLAGPERVHMAMMLAEVTDRQIAEQLGCSLREVRYVIDGRRDGPRIEKAIATACKLSFNEVWR